MRILLLFAHPSEKSFNRAIVERLRRALSAHELIEHDLYREKFDPVLPQAEILRRYSLEPQIQTHFHDLQRSDALIVVHPDWWGQPPAILKGWVDRILRPGVAYDYEGPEFGRKHAVPLLGGRRGLAFITTDSEASQVRALFDMIWRDRIFGFCGIQTVAVEVFTDVRYATRRVTNGYLERVERLAQRLAAAQTDPGGLEQ